MKVKDFLVCPVCWEPFNVVENVPYIFWCGHTLCKTCVFSLRWAQVKFLTPPIQFPFFISCPWCQLPCLRLVWNGNLQFPRKNFSVLWLVEMANGNRVSSHNSSSSLSSIKSVPPSTSTSIHQTRRLLDPSTEQCHQELHTGSSSTTHGGSYIVRSWWVRVLLQNLVSFSTRSMAKFPLVVVLMLVVLYVIPASAAVLIAYLLLTFLFAFPSFIVLYFSFPVLDSLVREIIA